MPNFQHYTNRNIKDSNASHRGPVNVVGGTLAGQPTESGLVLDLNRLVTTTHRPNV